MIASTKSPSGASVGSTGHEVPTARRRVTTGWIVGYPAMQRGDQILRGAQMGSSPSATATSCGFDGSTARPFPAARVAPTLRELHRNLRPTGASLSVLAPGIRPFTRTATRRQRFELTGRQLAAAVLAAPGSGNRRHVDAGARRSPDRSGVNAHTAGALLNRVTGACSWTDWVRKCALKGSRLEGDRGQLALWQGFPGYPTSR